MSDHCASSEDTAGTKAEVSEAPPLYANESSGGDLTVMTKSTSPSWADNVRAELRKRFIDGFTPVYFASVMGTGMSANLLYNFPYHAHWLEVCGIILALVGLVIFIVLCSFFAVALYQRPTLMSQIHRDPAFAPAMGCFVMGYTTLITFLHGILGKSWIIGIWVLWWLVVAGSFYTGIVTFFFSLMAKHRKSKNLLEHSCLNLLYLLPVVALTVAAALGGLITADLPNTNLKVVTMTITLIMWSIAMLLASIITTINFWRMLVHKIPHSGQVLTMFLPIGFAGQGAFAILLFGRNSTLLLLEHQDKVSSSAYVSFINETANKNNISLANLPLILSTAIMAACTIVAFMLMAFGFLLTIFAYMSVLSKMAPFAVKKNNAFLYLTTSRLPFKKLFVGLLRFQRAFWSMTFPIGTMALATHEFYNLYNGFYAFKVVATIYSMMVVVTTLGCLVGVVYKAVMMVIRAFYTKELKQQETV